MKSTKLIVIICILMSSLFVKSQNINYKKLTVPSVNIKGEILNAKGTKIGLLDDQGNIFSPKNEKIAYIDAFGTLIETKNVSRIAKCDVNGNVYAIKISKGYFKGWKLTMPEPGVEICLLKDDKKKLVAATHKHFKQYGGVAIYYLLKKSKK